MCVCVCVRDRAREKERERESERARAANPQKKISAQEFEVHKQPQICAWQCAKNAANPLENPRFLRSQRIDECADFSKTIFLCGFGGGLCALASAWQTTSNLCTSNSWARKERETGVGRPECRASRISAYMGRYVDMRCCTHSTAYVLRAHCIDY